MTRECVGSRAAADTRVHLARLRTRCIAAIRDDCPGRKTRVKISVCYYLRENTQGIIPNSAGREVLVNRDDRTDREEAIDDRAGPAHPDAALGRARPALRGGLRAARLDQPDPALCAVRHLAVEPGNRTDG